MYKLRKALYGLKQAPRAWNNKLVSFLIEKIFTKCISEHGAYVNNASRFSRVIICLYVDHLQITGADEAKIERVK